MELSAKIRSNRRVIGPVGGPAPVSSPVISGEELYYLKNKMTGISLYVNPGSLQTETSLEYSPGSDFSSFTTIAGDTIQGSGNTIVGFIIQRLSPGTYYFRVKAVNSAGSSVGQTLSFIIYPGARREQTDYSALLTSSRALMTGTTYYIDPTATVNGNGLTEATPFDSWSRVSNVGSNRNYLQKAGTTAQFTAAFNAVNGACRIGTYGGSQTAKMLTTGYAQYFMQTSSMLLLENIEIESTYKVLYNTDYHFTGAGLRLRNSPGSIVYNCKIHGWGMGIVFHPINGSNGASWRNVRVLYSAVFDCATDGIFSDDVTGVEIGHCDIYNVNMLYASNTNDRDPVNGVPASDGDGIQLQFTEVASGDFLEFNIHDCTIDRRSTGNKFCIIWGAGPLNLRAQGQIFNNEFLINGLNENALYSDYTNIGIVDISYNIFTGVGSGQGFHSRTRSLALLHHNVFDRFAYCLANEGASIVEMYNNTIINCGACYGVDALTGGVKFNRNIVKSSNSAHRVVYGTAYNKITESDNNCYNMPVLMTAAPTLPEFRTLIGRDANSISLDPQLDTDYTLLPGSPCLNHNGGPIGAYS